ncbi:MAG: PAS domain S-box protein [Gammaproteobacteria bacterium]|jgi:PAS domain S-box-containing protein|nr:PAS domain S-box protein [Gammaproteobacteria bacterium]MBU0770116.1 PAS domain S-box protein [Gammaproteobacteria bacterium]MBU0855335.1 PAS domain S-box protein [Gammaproteobacteria bacterium]MBU1845902.1 PAS domain S-box protein [Gammaproteobacteria bacterium]
MDAPTGQNPEDLHTGTDAGISAKVTAPLMNEDAFRRVVEYAPSAMVMIDAGGTIVLVNAQTETLFNYPRAALIGESVDILVPARARAHHAESRQGFLGAPRPRPMGAGRDLFARRSDGSEFPVEIGLNPMETEEGVMVLASIVDITERRRAQQVLEQALLEKTVLLNEVHHRVKNNLQVISSLLNLQASNVEDPRVREILNESQNRVRAMALTHQLLYERKDFSRMDLGEYLDRLSQLLLSAYRGGAERISLRLMRPEAQIHLDLERAIPCGLLVSELVTNAFKHAFPGEQHGTIEIRLEACGTDEVLLTVRDDGIGLPADFDITAIKSLGLQLVPLLVDQLHGGLDIGSGNCNGPGAHFSVRFSNVLPTRSPA